jgi:AsmA-like C-terminal region
MPRRSCNRAIARTFCRGLAALLVVAVVAGAAALRYWTDPVTVRRLVLDGLRKQFPGAEVSVDSARVWPGWGIQVTNLTLARKDDPALTPVLQVPYGRIEHDYDSLKEGRLRIRRLKLDRPRLTAIRNAEGKWNVDGLIAPPNPGTPLPIMVIERGTVVLRIAPPGGGESVWEFGDVRASLLDEPGCVAKFEGKASALRLGRFAIEGVWHRECATVSAALDLSGLPVGIDLLHELARFVPLPMEQLRHIGGEARVQLDVRRVPDASPSWQTDWRLTLKNGRLGLRDLPLDLEAVELRARLHDGRLTIEDAHARAAGAPVHALLVAKLPNGDPVDAVETLAVSAEHLLVTPELFARLPEAAKRFHQRFSPVGQLGIVYQYAKRTGGGSNARLELTADDMSGRYHKFPYPLRRVGGKIVTDFVDSQPTLHTIDISAEVNGGARAAVRGTVGGAEPHPAVDLWITSVGDGPANNVPFDEDLIAALPPRFQPLARSFHIRGNCSVVARIHHGEGDPHGHDQYRVRCRDAALCYDAFPVPLDHVAAELEIHLGPGMAEDPNSGDHWILRNATAMHGRGAVTVTAWNTPAPHGQCLIIDSTGVGVPLNESLKGALTKYRLGSTWDLLSPSGNIDFSSRVTLTDREDATKEPTIALALRNVSVTPGFFPYPFTDVAAKLHVAEGRVLLGECTGRHGPARLHLSGGEIRTSQGLWVDVRDLTAGPLTPDAELLRALPPGWQKATAAMQPRGEFTVDLKRLLFHDPPAIPGPPGPPTVNWDGSTTLVRAGWTAGVAWSDVTGSMAFRGAAKGNRLDWFAGHAAFDHATVMRQPIEQMHAQLTVETGTPDVLQIRDMNGRVFGGTLAGEARVAFGGGLDYAADLKALGVRLEEFGEKNGVGGRLEGRATAQLYLSGHGTGLDELTGRGGVDVPTGKLYDLPIALELLKAISLRLPDGAAFDEAHAAFKIEGRRLKVERLDLLGSAVSLGGHGGLNLDGTGVDLDFCAVWARIVQVLPVSWRDVPPWVSQQILKIRMGGSLSDPTFAPEPVPFLTEPVKRLLDRTNGRNQKTG